jgi:outer membrane protein assembly factor BamA
MKARPGLRDNRRSIGASAVLAAILAGGSLPAQSPSSPGRLQLSEKGEAPTRLPTPPASASEPIVADVQIVGNKQVSKERIQSYLRTHKGRPYNEQTAQADAGRVYSSQLFYDVKVDHIDTPEGVVVVVKVLERPRIAEVQFLGNRELSNDKLVEITGLRPGKAMDPASNQMAVREIETKYREKGYPFVEVELLEGAKDGDLRVTIRINEGPKTKISSIRFEGANFVGGAVLKTKIKSGTYIGVGKVGILGNYEAELIDQDIDALRTYYRRNGFLDVRISHKKEFNTDKSRVWLTYLIDEGPRYKVGNVAVAGAKKFDERDRVATMRAHRHFRAVVLFARDRLVDFAAVFFRFAVHERDVGLKNFAVPKLLGQFFVNLFRFCDDDQARRIFVEAMHDADSIWDLGFRIWDFTIFKSGIRILISQMECERICQRSV